MMLKFQVALLAALLLFSSGCTEQTQQQVQDTGKAVVEDVKENAQQAVEATKDAAADAEVTTSVKSALMASEKMDTTALNVDTIGKNVYLRGYVADVEQKTLAESIAKNTVAADFAVNNELLVGMPTDSPSPEASATDPSSPGTIVDDSTPPVPYDSPSPSGTPATEM